MSIASVKKVTAQITEKIGISLLPKSTQRFIYTHFNFTLFTTIPGVFINTFFFNQDGKISTVAIFSAILYVVQAIFMHFASMISFKKDTSYIIRLGIILYNLFFIALLILQTQASKYMVFLALIDAAANGFYWQGYNEYSKLLTSEGNFDRTISMLGMVGSIVNLIVPVVSGYIIVLCPSKNIGYSIIFIISFLFSLYTIYLSRKLKKFDIHLTSNIKGMYHYIFTDKIAFVSCSAELLRGIRNASFPLFLSIIFYRQVMNEGILGINTTVSGLAAIITYIIAARILRPNNRLKYILISTSLSVILFSSLFLSMSPVILFIITIVNSILAVFIDNPLISYFYSIFRDIKNGVNFSQLMSGREVFFGVGRAIGLVILIVLSNTTTQLAVFALIVNLTGVASFVLYRYAYKKFLTKEDH